MVVVVLLQLCSLTTCSNLTERVARGRAIVATRSNRGTFGPRVGVILASRAFPCPSSLSSSMFSISFPERSLYH